MYYHNSPTTTQLAQLKTQLQAFKRQQRQNFEKQLAIDIQPYLDVINKLNDIRAKERLIDAQLYKLSPSELAKIDKKITILHRKATKIIDDFNRDNQYFL